MLTLSRCKSLQSKLLCARQLWLFREPTLCTGEECGPTRCVCTVPQRYISQNNNNSNGKLSMADSTPFVPWRVRDPSEGENGSFERQPTLVTFRGAVTPVTPLAEDV